MKRYPSIDGMPDKRSKLVALPTMFKIKSDAWRNKLKEKCQGDTALFNKLV